ncbi:hypothetical protein ACH5RR_034301 [Cinchona calisaya]|uniref:Uncharacterized protein n=1 Tax=Cinchona calisaya TaxID=153742 RepID=A0ABD2YF25_9GENT
MELLKAEFFKSVSSSLHALVCGGELQPHKFARQFGFCQDLPDEHSEEFPALVLERNGSKTLTELFLSFVNDSTSGSVLGSKVDAEAIAMDEGTNSRKICALQEVQDEIPTDDHPSRHPS